MRTIPARPLPPRKRPGAAVLLQPRNLALAAMAAFLLYPFIGLLTPVGSWQWDAGVAGSSAAAVEVSLGLTGLAVVLVAVMGTPVAWLLARSRHRIWWEAPILLSVLLPPLALGLLLSASLGPAQPLGRMLLRLGVPASNSPFAFVLTQCYSCLGYYLLAARSAFDGVEKESEQTAGSLGLTPGAVFWRVTFPMARSGLAVALSLAWVRALGEFGAVMVTAYYPAGMPVQLWINLQDAGLPGVMPLLLIFLLAALPLPWLVQMMAQRRRRGLGEEAAA